MLSMIVSDQVVLGTRPGSGIAWAEQPYSGPPKIIIGAGRYNAVAVFAEDTLAETFLPEVRHVYHAIAIRALADRYGWNEANYNLFSNLARIFKEADAAAAESLYVRRDLLRVPACPTVP
jgi:hypothetical protein